MQFHSFFNEPGSSTEAIRIIPNILGRSYYLVSFTIKHTVFCHFKEVTRLLLAHSLIRFFRTEVGRHEKRLTEWEIIMGNFRKIFKPSHLKQNKTKLKFKNSSISVYQVWGRISNLPQGKKWRRWEIYSFKKKKKNLGSHRYMCG